MKIGVIGCFYGNADILPEVLAPWIELKRAGAPLVLTAINAQFKEYADLGYPNDDHATRAVLESHRADLDYLVIEPKPLMEFEVRNRLLDYARAQNVDAIWLLDGDELYTKEQIQKIVEYCMKVPEFDYYHIYFQNILFDTVPSRDTFCPPRIVRADRNGGIKVFVWDNEIELGDGIQLHDSIPGIIPRSVAHVKHVTWRKDAVQKKIAYSQKHFGFSILINDPSTGKVVYNKQWFDFYKMPHPVEYSDGTVGTPVPLLEVYVSLSDRDHGMQMKALWSLVRALLVLERANELFIRLSVHGVNISQEVRRFLELFPFDVRYQETEAFESSRSSSADLFFFSNDSVLYDSEALLEMFLDYRSFSRTMERKEIGLSLIDSKSLYGGALMEPERVVLGGQRHWRTVRTTAGTALLLPREVIVKHGDFIRQSLLSRSKDGTPVFDWDKRFILFSPVPSLATLFGVTGEGAPFFDTQSYLSQLEPKPRVEHRIQ